jgi:hypothetical protein
MAVTRKSYPAKRSWENMSVKAGVLAGATYPEDEYRNAKTGKMIFDVRAGRSVAAIAAALEFGDHQRLARPFMHATSAEHGKEWVRALKSFLRDGLSVRGAFAAAGLTMKEDIRHTISTWPADNAEAWADIKGFDHGLILTSHLLNSIDTQLSEGAQ